MSAEVLGGETFTSKRERDLDFTSGNSVVAPNSSVQQLEVLCLYSVVCHPRFVYLQFVLGTCNERTI